MTNKYFDLESNNLQNLNSKAKNVGRNNNKMREVIYKTIDLSNKDREVNCSYNSLRSSDLRDHQASGQELRLSELEYDSIRNSYATERNDNLFSSKPKEDDLVEYECSKYPEKDSDNPFEYQPTTNENSSLIDSKSDQNTSNINEAIFIQDEMRVIPKDQQNELRENQDSANSVAASLVENENKFDIKDLLQSIIQNQNLESLPNSNDESLIKMKEKTELTSEKQESYISNQSNLQQNENSYINENKEYNQTDKKLQFIPNEDLNPEESHPYLIVQKDKIFESDLNSTQETISLKLEEIQPEKKLVNWEIIRIKIKLKRESKNRLKVNSVICLPHQKSQLLWQPRKSSFSIRLPLRWFIQQHLDRKFSLLDHTKNLVLGFQKIQILDWNGVMETYGRWLAIKSCYQNEANLSLSLKTKMAKLNGSREITELLILISLAML